MMDPLELGLTASPAMQVETLSAQVQAWLDEVESANAVPGQNANSIGRFASTTGYFVARDGSANCFVPVLACHIAADGSIRDGSDRAVLGYATGGGTHPQPLKVSKEQRARFARFEIDDRGVLSGIEAQRQGEPHPMRVELGRLCIALFPAPQNLAPNNDTYAATASSGQPRFVAADAANLAPLERTPSTPALARFRDNAQQMFKADRRAELDVALAGGEDLLDRVALDVVK